MKLETIKKILLTTFLVLVLDIAMIVIGFNLFLKGQNFWTDFYFMLFNETTYIMWNIALFYVIYKVINNYTSRQQRKESIQ